MADSDPTTDITEDPPVKFHVKTGKEEKLSLEMPLSTSVADLKAKLAEMTEIAASSQRLIYAGRVMKDDEVLNTYGVKAGNTIHLVKGAASNARAAAGGNAGPSAAAAPGAAPRIPTNIAAGSGNNPLAGLTGARYAGLASLPNASMFGPDGGMGPPPSNDQMIDMMNQPGFASTMNEMLQNPQMLDMIINSNPALRSIPGAREMMQSAEFRRMMTDPEMLRQAGQMQRMFGGGRGAAAQPSFPAPGVTDTTPQPEGQQQQQQPQQQAQTPGGFPAPSPFAMPPGGGNPFAMLFGAPSAGAAGAAPTGDAAGASTGGAAATGGQSNPPLPGNPYASLANIFGVPPATTSPGAAGAAPGAGAASGAATNPLAALFGGAGAGAPGGAAPQNQPDFATMLQQLQTAFGPGAGGAGGVGAFNPYNLGMLAGLGGGLGGAGAPGSAAPPVDTRPPEERYAEQLRQLNDMGFYDFDRNVAALRRSGGSVQGAVQHLLGD